MHIEKPLNGISIVCRAKVINVQYKRGAEKQYIPKTANTQWGCSNGGGWGLPLRCCRSC